MKFKFNSFHLLNLPRCSSHCNNIMASVQNYFCFYDVLEKFQAELETLLNEKWSGIYILSDELSFKHCFHYIAVVLEKSKLPFHCITFEPGENSKNFEKAIPIWSTLKNIKADRNSLIINLGGGVVTDLGGFIASVYMRGISFLNIPTTLLGMVDAALGGKNGIDFEGAKNILGSIKQPIRVISFSGFLKSLPKRQLLCGWAEMLKHGLIADQHHFEQLIKVNNPEQIDLSEWIKISADIKMKIVESDPDETASRKKLNFGHTIGHAIESYFNAKLGQDSVLHGEAVAAGIILASYISHQTCNLSAAEYQAIVKAVDQYFDRLKINNADFDGIISYLKYDKKSFAGANRMVLLQGIGHAIIDVQITDELIQESLINYSKDA